MKKLLKFGKNNSLKYNFHKDLPKIMYKSFAKPFYNQHNIIMDYNNYLILGSSKPRCFFLSTALR